MLYGKIFPFLGQVNCSLCVTMNTCTPIQYFSFSGGFSSRRSPLVLEVCFGGEIFFSLVDVFSLVTLTPPRTSFEDPLARLLNLRSMVPVTIEKFFPARSSPVTPGVQTPGFPSSTFRWLLPCSLPRRDRNLTGMPHLRPPLQPKA